MTISSQIAILFIILVHYEFYTSTLVLAKFTNNIEWSGGPLHLECELTTELLAKTGQYIKDNVIAVKAASYKGKIYLSTPRLKHGVVSTISEMVMGRIGPELLPYPDIRSHTQADCHALQNAVDFYLDSFGNLWALDSGIIETLESPRCTCPPKVVSINLKIRKVTRVIDLSELVEPTSLLQNIVVDYAFGSKPYIYVSDASRGAIIVHDTVSGWIAMACAPSAGLQMVLVKQSLMHNSLLMVRIPHPGILEYDTASLQRKHTHTPVRVFGDHVAPVILLGSNTISHKAFLRFEHCSKVSCWNVNEVFNRSSLVILHTPSASLVPSSVASDPMRPSIVILDSNYADSIHKHRATYHRITVIPKV